MLYREEPGSQEDSTWEGGARLRGCCVRPLQAVTFMSSCQEAQVNSIVSREENWKMSIFVLFTEKTPQDREGKLWK